VRTLASDEAAFGPLEYHDGTVWPHDNSLIALGLARVGRVEESRLIVRALLDASVFYDGRLPELFAGYERNGAEPPVEVPTSARPQAWAAGTPALLLRALLQLEPEPASRSLRAFARGLPTWLDGLELEGVRAYGRRWRVRVQDGAAVAEPVD
jgi:glycogen debranching enzyme